MMNFTCAHCEKVIRCSAILIDGEFLHSSCEAAYIEAKEEKENDVEDLIEI